MSALSKAEKEHLMRCRWKARTDKMWLARSVLGYDRLVDHIHGPMTQKLQQFLLPPSRDIAMSADQYLDKGGWKYTPWNDPYDLDGNRRVMIFFTRGWFKCLLPGTKISLKNGAYKNVEDLCIGDAVKSFETGKETWALVTAKELQPIQPGVEVSFFSGRKISCSANHPFLVGDDWILAENLRPLDKVILLNTPFDSQGPYLPYAEALGWFLGDGNLALMRITNNDTFLQQKIVKAVERAGGKATIRPRKNRATDITTTGMCSLIKQLGLRKHKSGTKFIPEVFFAANNRTILELLYGLFMSDGGLSTSGIRYTSKSIRLVQDIQRLLVRFGIAAKYYRTGAGYYVLNISSTEQVERFLAIVPWNKKHEWTAKTGNNLNHTKDIHWDKVREVKPLGAVETWGIETSSGILVADDLVTHNTTMNTITDTIQWILNYPHLGYAIFFSTGDKAEDTLKNEIKKHFQTNPRFRELFPDYCPTGRGISEWGNAQSIIVPNRDDILLKLGRPPRKEPTVSTLSIDKAGVGYHYDVIKCSDIVDPTNVMTPQMRKEVKYRFGLLKELLVKVPGKPKGGWINVEGTFYHYDDLYNDVIREWRKQLPEERIWDIFVGGCFQRDTGQEIPKYDPNEMLLPFRLDENGKRIPTWPEIDPLEKLEQEERDPIEGGLVFACQKILDMDAVQDEFLKPLQIPIGWVKREAFNSVPVVYRVVVGDFADTQGKKANPSCLCTFAVDRDGRAYLEDVRHGKFSAEELIGHMFDLQKTFNPFRFVIEDTAYVHGLKPSIDRISHKSGIYPNFVFHPAPRTTDKATRIINALQPAIKRGDLRLVEPFTGCDHRIVSQVLMDELRGVTPLSTGASDDIIDCCAYFFLDREWMGQELIKDGAYLTPEARLRLIMEMLTPKQTPSIVHQIALRKMVFEHPIQSTDGFSKAGW